MRRKDPCYQFVPSVTQRAFLNDNTYFVLLCAGGRAGKTTTALVDLSMVARNIHPTKTNPNKTPLTIICLCLSRQQASMVVQHKLFHASEVKGPAGELIPASQEPMIPKTEIKKLHGVAQGFRVEYECQMKNGNKIVFMWSDDPGTERRIQGVEAHYVYIDENAGTKKLLIEVRKRVANLQNPLNGWFGLVRWGATGTIVNEAFEDFRRRCQDPRDASHKEFRIREGENPAFAEAARERLGNTMSDEERKIHLSGEASAMGLTLVYGKQWSDDRHMRKADYIPHASDNLYLGYDPGVDHPTGMLIVAINKNFPLTLNCIRFWAHSRETLDDDVRRLSGFLRGRRLAGVAYDWAANAQTKAGRGESVLTMLQTTMLAANLMPHTGFFKSMKAHWPGICLVRHYLSPDPSNLAVPPMIYVNPSDESGCQRFRQEMLSYRGKEETRFTGAGGIVKKDDEGPDVIRYLVVRRFAYNAEWACGPTLWGAEGPREMETIEPPAPPEFSGDPMLLPPYQRHLLMSRQRPRKDRKWTARVF